MQQEMKNKNKKASTIFWILTFACMVAIFYFSQQPANDSSAQSGFVLQLLQKLFPTISISEHIVRKLAHFSEFAGLSLLANSAMLFTKGKLKIVVATSISSLYAITDEIHQIFIEGRACQFGDWLIDTSGAITGMIAFLLIYFLVSTIIRKFKTSKEERK